MKDKTIFDYLNDLTQKHGLKYDKKAAPAYLLSLWLSHDSELLPMVNAINAYQFILPDDVIYKYYYAKIPQGRRYIKWVKKVGEKSEELTELREELQLSKRETEKYRKLFTMLE